MRKATTLLAILASLLFYAFAFSTPASADPNSPGNNGTVKIHNAQTEVEDMRNEPHVCTFYVDGFKFDNNQSGQWWINSWSPTGDGSEVKRGSWTADGTGSWHSGVQTLPPGHYKLYAKQQNELAPGGNKQKVFWVECATSTTGTTTGTVTTGTTTGTVTTGTTTGTVITGTTTGTVTTGTTTGTTVTTGTSTGSSTGNSNGNSSGNAVAGIQTPPANGVGTVSPIVQAPVSSAVNGAQTAANVGGVEGLPSTSTDAPAVPLAALGFVLMAMGGFILRRDQTRA
jgi:hypothetical protein